MQSEVTLLGPLMSFKRHCYCDGLLVSERTERSHRNGPPFRLEAASRQPGRQKRQKLERSFDHLLPDANLNFGHSEVDLDVENGEQIATVEQDVNILNLIS